MPPPCGRGIPDKLDVVLEYGKLGQGSFRRWRPDESWNETWGRRKDVRRLLNDDGRLNNLDGRSEIWTVRGNAWPRRRVPVLIILPFAAATSWPGAAVTPIRSAPASEISMLSGENRLILTHDRTAFHI